MHPPSFPHFSKGLLRIGLLFLPTALFAQTDITFSGTGVWSNPAGWDLEQVPGSDKAAVINSGTLTIDGVYGVGSLKFGGGTIQGEIDAATDSITLLETSRTGYWRGGLLKDVTLAIGSGVTFEIEHSGNATSSAAIIEVHSGATVDWLSGDILLNDGGIINNAGEWNALADARIRRSTGAVGTFNNLAGAIYRKQGSLNSTFDERFNNDGTLYVEAGALIIDGQGTMSSSGVIDVASTASLYFSQSYTIADAAGLQGGGNYVLSGGTLTLDGISTVALQMDGGVLTGNQTFANGFQWNNGDIQNGTTLNDLSSSFEINDPTGNLFDAHALTNHGTVDWNDGDILLNNGSTITNNGSFQDQAAGSEEVHRIRTSVGTTGTFSNNGFATYHASGGGTTDLEIVFENFADATVSVTDGSTLIFDGSGTAYAGSTITADASSAVIFDNNFTVVDAASLLGSGQFSLLDGTLTLDGAVGVSNFIINGGTLLGNQTFNGGASWYNGTLGPGMLTNGADSTFNIGDEFGNILTERTVINNGQMVWSDGDILLNDASTITNQNAFEDEAAGAGQTHRIRKSAGTTGLFTVGAESSYTKTSAGTTEIETGFNVDGAVNVQAGTLAIEGPGSMTSSATINAATGATVQFNSVFGISNAVGLQGEGAFSLQGGTLTMSGTVEVPDFTLNGGTLLGFSTFNNGLIWNNGILGADGSTTIGIESVMAINDATGNNFDAHSLFNEGRIDWNDGDILLNSGSSITNNGTFNDNAAASGETHRVRTSIGSGAYVSNYTDGTYNKTSEGITEISVALYNDGALNVLDGKLTLSGGGYANSGSTLFADSDAEVLFSSDFSIFDAAALQGSGQFTISSGTVSINGEIGANDLHLTGGSLTGTLSFLDGATMTGGKIANATVTNASNSTFVFASPTNNELSVTTFSNEGQVNWTSGDILLNVTASIINSSTGTWTDSAAASGETRAIRTSIGSPSTFTNLGTYEKDGEGTTRIIETFNNDGLVNVDSGTLELEGGGLTGSVGILSVASGAELVFDSSYEVTNAFSLQGDGQFTLRSGNLSMGGTVAVPDFTITGGTLLGNATFTDGLIWNDGILGSGGVTHNGTGSTFAINDSFGNTVDGNTIINDGTTNWNDGDILLNNGSTLTNSGTWNDLAAGTGETHKVRTSTVSATYFTNLGTYEKDSPGTTTFDVDFNNDGDVNVTHGALLLNSGGTALAESTFNVASGALLSFTGGYVVNDATSLLGTGRFTLESGELSLTGTVSVPDFEINGGTLTGIHTFTANATWTGGSLGFFGTTTNASGSTFTLANSINNIFTSHSFENDGEVLWNSGSLLLNDGSGFSNRGQLFDQTLGDVSMFSSVGFPGYFFNDADSLYQKSSAGTTTVNVSFVNYGAIEILAGTLALADGGYFSDTATATVAADTVLEFDGDTTIEDASGLTGEGLFTHSGGTLNLSGELNAYLVFYGGTLTGTPTILGTLQIDDGKLGSGSHTTVGTGGRVLFNDANDTTLDSHGFFNEGTTEIIQGDLRLDNGSTFENSGSLVIDSTASGANFNIFTAVGQTGTLQNETGGSILHQGDGTTTFNLPLNNNGEVSASVGHIVVQGGGSAGEDATFFAYADSGSTITFKDDYSLLDIASLQGDGTFLLTGGLLSTDGILGAELVVNGGGIDGEISVDGHLRILSGGPLPGNNLTINSGGQFTLDSLGDSTLTNALITIASGGTLKWNSGNILLDGESAVLNSGDIVVNTPGQLGPASSAPGQALQNDGSLFKLTGSGDTFVNVPLTSTGYIELQGGRLFLSQDSTFTSSSTVIISGADTSQLDNESNLEDVEVVSSTELVISGGTTVIEDASSFSGDGAIVLNNGLLDIEGDLGVGLVLNAGSVDTTQLRFERGFAFNGGSITPGASLTLLSGAQGLINAPSFDFSDISLSVHEAARLSWILSDLVVNTGSTFSVDGLLLVESDQSLSYGNGTGSRLQIGGTGELRKINGSGTTLLDIPVDLAGRLDVLSGAVEIGNGGTSDAGSFHVGSGFELKFTDGYTFDNGTTTTGNGTLKLLAGSFSLNDNIGLGLAAQLLGGTYSGTHNLTGNITWTGGEFDSAGTTTIANNGVFALSKTDTHELNRDFTVNGQLLWNDGDINGTEATLTNNGNVLITTDGTISSTDDSLEIHNHGIFAKVGGTGTTTVDVPFTNEGLVFGGTGTLHFADTFDLAGGSLSSSPGAFITFAAPLTFNAATTLAGNGTITADITTGGTVSPGASVGTLTINGDLTLTSGAISFFEIDVVSSVLTFDRLTVSGTLELAGDLEIDFLTTVDPISTDMFTLYTAATLQGEFANVVNGGQVWTDLSDGGRGIFTVNYGPTSIFDPNSVILTNFEFSPIPEPSTWLLMVTGLALIGFQTRRRRA